MGLIGLNIAPLLPGDGIRLYDNPADPPQPGRRRHPTWTVNAPIPT
ncbi:hypothetical protein [Acrocarpospora corrugata]|nr:hypothetical protein [Acrocarpospora corrugata]